MQRARSKDGKRVSPKEAIATMKRLLGYMFRYYKFHLLIVAACILISAFTTVQGTLFSQSLVDDYILPMASSQSPDFGPLAGALVRLGVLFGIGIVCNYAYNRIMVNVTQGTMKQLRDALFKHMETLPIKYFDTHAHGDIMSVYTNDIDTLRQLISQSIPQMFNSVVNLIFTFVSMIILDIPLTVVTVLMAGVMLFVSGKISANSGKYYVRQQVDLGVVNGFIEEMLEGQKVVKVFCHEEQAKEDFRKRNDELRDSADKANRYANLMMPVNANIGNLSYVLCAVVGALLVLAGFPGMTIGTIVAFVSLNKGFNQPIIQISQQTNFVVMGSAGAKRVFAMMDEEPEKDNGYVEFVNAKELPDGSLTECEERTGVWAWKHPHKADGTVTYTRLEGGVVFDGVDFGYDDSKIVLHDIKLYATPGQKIAFVGSTGAGKTTITASTTSRTARSATTASTSPRSKSRPCARPWASSCRIRTCSPAPSWTTSATAS